MENSKEVQALTDRLMSGEETLSYSSLSAFGESPKSFLQYKFKTKVQTPAMFYGSVVHCLLLEPEDFDNRYFIVDDTEKCNQIGGAKPRATKVYKEWLSILFAQNTGKILIDPQCYQDAKAAQKAVLSNWPANRILKECNEKELKAEWEYENFKFRGFIDGRKKGKMKMDLKTCADASPRKFQRDIVQMDYHLQAAMYNVSDGEDVPYYIIAVDKTGGVSVHLLDGRLMSAGMERYDFLMENLNLCILKEAFTESFNFYSDRGDGIFVAERPNYLY